MTERAVTGQRPLGRLGRAGRSGRAGWGIVLLVGDEARLVGRPTLSSCPIHGTTGHRPPDLGELRPLPGPKSSKISPALSLEGLG
ncbi:hypothetical protein GA0070608_3721 [Micromonospora peucetia]|uniref:Uncharacterized protein n=1 Tax=Micromonospora peucetia TaxID=47871 RepID=A0A1C6VQ44_9ACTN|nr:hypothetical protein GA0070608_3721 [Micromonospora peucetia]